MNDLPILSLIVAIAQGGVGEFVTESIKQIPWLKERLTPAKIRVLSLLVIVALAGAYSSASSMGWLEAGTFGATALASMRFFYHQSKKGRIKGTQPDKPIIETPTIKTIGITHFLEELSKVSDEAVKVYTLADIQIILTKFLVDGDFSHHKDVEMQIIKVGQALGKIQDDIATASKNEDNNA